MKRATWIAGCTAITLIPSLARAQALTPLDVAYAGSMGSMMEGAIKADAARALHVAMHGRGQGADALAELIVGGSISPDVFIAVTPGPMKTVLAAGKARAGVPIARTEMVIAYSPKSKYAQQFADAAAGKPGAMPWWQVLQQPGLRFGRTDPTVDPQGRNIIFTLQLAQAYYKQPGLAERILGSTMNPAQIFSEPSVAARLQSGELDAASAYKIQPGPFHLPYLRLPQAINLGNESLHRDYAKSSLELHGKTHHPQPLVYYAAALTAAAHPQQAQAFVEWLAGGEQSVLRENFYDAPVGASTLHA